MRVDSGDLAPTRLAPSPEWRGADARSGTLEPGDVLNGIYRVEGFLGQGGMGDVYRGLNIESGERVAIKVLRAHLAQDAQFVAMFRREAAILTPLAHPALTQYRVFAREPVLNLLYIVTDFIEGESLLQRIERGSVPVASVLALAHRLAAGLQAAHDHGAVHRDISPDNILLPRGRIEQAKIIDFGIAKSLDLSAATLVGGGFAGKIGYVAPEQFGDFNHQVGPWTDIYSLGLVLLAAAIGRPNNMGSSLSEAVERRRIGPDLSDCPAPLHPLLEDMLVADPAGRIRSMAELSNRLRRVESGEKAPAAAFAEVRLDKVGEGGQTMRPSPVPVSKPAAGARSGRSLVDCWPWVAAAAAALALGTLIASGLPGLRGHASRPNASGGGGGGGAPRPAAVASAPPSAKAAAPSAPAETLSRLDAKLASRSCTWVWRSDGRDIGVERRSSPRRVSGNEPGIAAATPAQCPVIDTLRTLDREADGVSLRVAAMPVDASSISAGCTARSDLTFTIAPGGDFALFKLAPNGALQALVPSRVAFKDLSMAERQTFSTLADGRMQARLCERGPGAHGYVLLSGPGAAWQADVDRRKAADIAAWAQARGWVARSAWLTSAASPLNHSAALATSSLDPTLSRGDIRQPCFAYVGRDWRKLGSLSRDACIQAAFRDDCNVTYAQSGSVRLQRTNGAIAANQGQGWATVAAPSCTVGSSKMTSSPGLLHRLWPWGRK
jgi:hypothetical protein